MYLKKYYNHGVTIIVKIVFTVTPTDVIIVEAYSHALHPLSTEFMLQLLLLLSNYRFLGNASVAETCRYALRPLLIEIMLHI
jgi:hypothetical protein